MDFYTIVYAQQDGKSGVFENIRRADVLGEVAIMLTRPIASITITRVTRD